MQTTNEIIGSHQPKSPWNKGKLLGSKPPLQTKQVWAIRTKLQRRAMSRHRFCAVPCLISEPVSKQTTPAREQQARGKLKTMPAPKIASGVVHKLPPDLKASLASDSQALEAWQDISSLARNEWICWIGSAKKAGTRARRIERAIEDLSSGKRRPCCWPGCPHR